MSDKYSGDIDPEIAALLGTPLTPPRPSREPVPQDSEGAPSFTDLFEPKPVKKDPTESTVDLSRKAFAPIREFFEAPKPYFNDKNFYKTIVQDSGETGTKVHKILSDLMNAQDPETRGQSRMRFIPAWWEFLETIVRELSPRQTMPRRLAIRFGVLLPSLIGPEQRDIIASVIFENKTGEPIHYIDEWLLKVGSGEVAPLATDEEVRTVKKGTVDNSLLMQKLEKLQGQFQAQSNLINIKQQEMTDLENSLMTNAQMVQDHEKNREFPSLKDVYSGSQRSALSSIQETLRRLASLDKELEICFRDLEKMKNELTIAEQKLNDSGGSVVDTKVVLRELGSLRQMCKMSCGRQGNHFPVLMKQYMPSRLDDIATRENVLAVMMEVERLDPGLFMRTFKGTQNRIVPHVILLPSFGEVGLCWEPFEKYNRSTSRGRVAVPMYSKNLKMAVIFALGDLRWQVAKERAGYRWMEEGLTGWYYQWFSERGVKGDVREYFIQDYILWLTKESEGTQKLDKDVRGIFWRNMPFPQEIREVLKNRGFVYNELYKKDINRAMSDGY